MSEAGSNTQLSDDHRQALAWHHLGIYVRALDAQGKANSRVQNVIKDAKKHGITKDALQTMRRLSTPEGEAELKSELLATIRAAGWALSPLGTQFSFLDEPDRTPLVDRAFNEGIIAGEKGETCTGEPYEGEIAQARIQGWHRGQEILMAALDLTKAGVQQIAKEAEEKAAKAAAPKEAAKKAKGRKKTTRKAKNGEAAAAPAFE